MKEHEYLEVQKKYWGAGRNSRYGIVTGPTISGPNESPCRDFHDFIIPPPKSKQ